METVAHKFVEMARLVNERAEGKITLEEMKRFADGLEAAVPTENALKVAANRYFRRDEEGNICEDWHGMLERVATDIATEEDGTINETLAYVFQCLMEAGLFFPNSPTLMNAGTPVQQLQACFVLPIDDSMESIFETLKHSALIQKSGGGVGYFLGKIRQKGAIVRSTGGQASGPLSFLSVYNKVSDEIRQGGRRRGASLATMNYNHPDIMEFIDSKRRGGELSNFNISVRVDNRFMEAVEKNEEYDLVEPHTGRPTGQKLKAGDVFTRICENAHLNGEPGLLFYDAINAENPTPHLGEIEATNPCGEQPLLPYESCNLGSINLARMLKKEGERFVPDWEKIRYVAQIATIFLDRVIDRNKSPLPQIDKVIQGNRKIGLGIMGLAQYLIRQGIPYNSEESFRAAEKVMKEIAVQSKITSRELAAEKGPFPNYKGSVWDKLGLPQRNATTTTIAPTGSLSIFADASPSAEPLFGVGFARNIMDGRFIQIDPVFEEMWRERFGEELPQFIKELIGEKGPEGISEIEEIPEDLRSLFLCAHDISPLDHIRMQLVLQKWVDNAVSKTINAPNQATVEDCREAFLQAWRSGAKGVTYYRDGSRESQVITSTIDKKKAAGVAKGERGVVPRERPETTFGQTTRKRIGFCGKLYVTVNKELREDGTEQVCEVFTSVGEEGCPPLSNALAKIISISIRAGVDIDEIVEQLREEKCPSCLMHPETTVLSCTDFIGQELAKAARGKVAYRLNAPGGPKNIRICSSCKIGNMIPDANCSYCDYCGFSTCG
ncbi:MAG: adenosylcobalamin-dependent ribonucleoside-diphosphate reductase [Firmicutes bacterium]|nr:adenosylcobalamin-dependent ribonucleoside-diphosphate reductase [Bacillota bacterium]